MLSVLVGLYLLIFKVKSFNLECYEILLCDYLPSYQESSAISSQLLLIYHQLDCFKLQPRLFYLAESI